MEVLNRADVAVECRRLAQSDVQAAVALGYWRGHGAFQRNAVAADGVEPVGMQVAVLAAVGQRWGRDFLPVKADAGGVEDAPGRSRDLGADAVPWNESYAMQVTFSRPVAS